MFQLSGITGQIILTFLGVFILTNSMAQVPTYTVDSNFDSGELFKDGAPVYDIYLHGDGRYLVGGGFNNFQSPVFGLGMVNGNGSWDNSWGSGFEYYDVLEIIAQEDGYIYPSIGGMEKILLEGIPWPVANQGYWSDYFMGGTNNPYNVERMWDIYQLDNGDLLIGGAIATDTLQPGLLRGITRMHANGSHDRSQRV